MDDRLNSLFTPWKIRNLEIKNRIVQCSMGGTSIFGWMEPHHFDKEAANFLLERAKNNVGLILPGIAPIRNPIMGQWLYKGQKKFDELKKFMDEFHKTGSKMFVQLTAGFGRSMAASKIMETLSANKFLGFLAKPFLNMDYLAASCSPNPNRWSDKVITKELTIKQIEEMVEAFAKTAKLCKDAGVDGIEVHAVHEGYLIDQFTMKYTNQRTDKYGGSFENRYRFPVEIVKAIKRECGEDYPVSLRYSVISKTKGFREGALPGEEYQEVGRDFEESKLAAKYLQDAGYDMLNCDNGTYDAWYWAHPPGYMPNNCNLQDVIEIRKYVDIPVVCAGKMTLEDGARAVENNEIDAVGFARQFLTDPEFITKVLQDRKEDIKPCIHCHNGCFNFGSHKGVPNDQPLYDTMHMSRCALNPRTMQHKKYKLEKVAKPKNIAIIGAGIAGLESAIVLTTRGHHVTIYEKTDRIGGVFNEAAALPFKDADKALLLWYKKKVHDLNIDIKFNTEVKNITELNADEILICTGSKPRKLNIKGFDKSIEACEYLDKSKEVGKKVVIIGGGLTGCEIAYNLLLEGHEVTVVESANDLIVTPNICLANTSFLREALTYYKADVKLESTVSEITDSEVLVRGKNGNLTNIPYDTVISAVGYIPTPLAEKSSHVHIIGDALKVGNLRTVIWRAWDVCDKL